MARTAHTRYTNAISDPQRRALIELCTRYGVQRLALFGSAASGRFDPQHSDMDLLVDFGPPPGTGLADQFFRFQEELKALFGRDVDLLERQAISNPYLRESAEETEVVLYAA